MSSIAKKIVVDERGNPLEVIIAWSDYQDLAESMGWDLSEQKIADIKEAREDWESGKSEAFVSLSEVK